MKRENKRISTGKNRGGETNLRKKENKWIRPGKNRGGGEPKEKRKKWISTGKNRSGVTTEGKEKTNGLVHVKTGVGDYLKKRENK